MSNRPRRKLLSEYRLRAVAFTDSFDAPDDDAEFSAKFPDTATWNRELRWAYRSICRDQICSHSAIRPDPGLSAIQARNAQKPFNPLREEIPYQPEHLKEFGNSSDPLFLWRKTEAVIVEALDFLAPARRINRVRFDWMMWEYKRNAPEHPNQPKDRGKKDAAACFLEQHDDYPAYIYRAFRKLRPRLSVVHQYGDRGNPWHRDHGSAARGVLRIDSRVSETNLYCLMALAACWWSLDVLMSLPVDPNDWQRDDLDYSAGKVKDAERWLAEAWRIEEGLERVTAEGERIITERQEAVSAKKREARARRLENLQRGPKGGSNFPYPPHKALVALVSKIGTSESKAVWREIERIASCRLVVEGVRFIGTTGDKIEWESEDDAKLFKAISFSSLPVILSRITQKPWAKLFINDSE